MIATVKATALAGAAILLVSLSGAGSAASLLTNSGGTYGEVAMSRNDDGFTSQQSLPFEINFYGQAFDSFFINNNGNITFGAGMGDFTPFSLGNLTQAMIAPYWADVDTRGALSGLVYVDSYAPGQLNVTWDRVGYFGTHDDKLNSFQLNLYKVGNSGDFDIEFRYSQLEWTTGDASDGINGLGGIPALAGWTNGAGTTLLQPGSFLSPGALNMAVESNVSPEEPGRWVYNIRNDAPPPVTGTTPELPITPTGETEDGGYEFSFDVSEDRVYYIDPPVATGYDFTISGGPLITSAVFTSPLTDLNGYHLTSLDGLTDYGWVQIGQTISFGSGISGFSLRDIDPANLLVPGDPLAFVYGLTFDQLGSVTVTQTPFIEEYTPPSGAVPEPASWAMMIAGLGLVGASMRRRAAKIAFA